MTAEASEQLPFEHLPAVLEESRPVAERFVAANHRVYLVGGIVRDLWLNLPLGDELDIDLTTDARPGTIKQLLSDGVDALWTQGERFGTIGAQLKGRAYEITTHRSEMYESDSRKPVVKFSNDINEDLSRRDFTVNAMAMELPEAQLVDPHGGANDLAAKVLRTPLTPEISFDDDPLRMLRAARFSSGYGLMPAPELVQAMSDMSARLDIVSAERIRDELDKLLLVAAPGSGLQLLHDTGLLTRFLPDVASLSDADRAWLFGVVDGWGSDARSRLVVLLAGAHLVTAGDAPFNVGARMRALRHSTERTQWTSLTGSAALAIARGEVQDLVAVRRWWSTAKGHGTAGLSVASALMGVEGVEREETVRRLMVDHRDDLDNLEVPLSGDEVMELLDCEPGRIVGEVLNMLQERRFVEGPLSAEQARQAVRDWHADQA